MLKEIMNVSGNYTHSITLSEGLLYSLLGILIVFVGLALLIAVIKIMDAVMNGKKKDAPAEVPAPTPVPAPAQPLAPGTAGEIKLYDTPDRDAVMLMAIVADELKAPLNELRFISIREVK